MSPTIVEKSLLATLILGTVALVGVPLGLGVVAAHLLPWGGGVRPSIGWWLAPILLAIFCLWLGVSSILDGAVKRLVGRAGRIVVDIAQTVTSWAVLSVLLLLVMADLTSAAIAGAVSAVLLLACAPLIDAASSASPRRGTGDPTS